MIRLSIDGEAPIQGPEVRSEPLGIRSLGPACAAEVPGRSRCSAWILGTRGPATRLAGRISSLSLPAGSDRQRGAPGGFLDGPARPFAARARAQPPGARGSGQIEPYRRPFPRLARDPDVAAGLLREACHLREPEAGALAGLLGGEERLAGPRRDLGRSCPFRYRTRRSSRRGPWRSALRACGERLIEGGIGRLDREEACLRHRIPRVDREIEECRLELAGIRGDAPDFRARGPSRW